MLLDLGYYLLEHRKKGTDVTTEELRAMKFAFINRVSKAIIKFQALQSLKNVN